jgi:hypothetical protein
MRSEQNKKRVKMFEIGEVISYLEMCNEEGVNLQRGMNYRLGNSYSVIFMSVRSNAPYADRIENDGKVLIYEGHDIPSRLGGPDPKGFDQPMYYPGGSLTQNGLFFEAAKNYQNGMKPEIVKVYEKVRAGIWTFNGYFRLVDGVIEISGGRKVFKFRLELVDQGSTDGDNVAYDLEHARIIPAEIKLEVWKRDRGRCVQCGSKDNLHFDHIIPFSKGGSSLVAVNIQLLCARHNLEKRDKIQ